MRNLNMTLDVYATIVMLILLVVCIVQSKQNKELNKYLIGWIITQIILFLCDTIRWSCRGKIYQLALFTASFHLEFILCYICLGFLHYYIVEYLNRRAGLTLKWRLMVWPIGVIISALWFASKRSRIFYIITYNAVNVRGDHYFLSQIPALCLLLFDIGVILSYAKKIGRRQCFQLVLPLLLPLVSIPLQVMWNVGVLFIGMTLSILSRYMTISSEQSRLLAESKARLAESRVEITLSQIQPHFLYNALGSISALCEEDPEKAKAATEHFAGYLRMNLESMRLAVPIPFERELKHIQTYIWLERMRFGDQLRFVQDIRERDFVLPALSVQPLVENAVKHGICTRQGGGTVCLSTYRDEHFNYILVKDDGKGFDVHSTLNKDDGELHIGIQNVRSRLAMMVGGELIIKSEIGKGTSALIRIPAQGEAYADRSCR